MGSTLHYVDSTIENNSHSAAVYKASNGTLIIKGSTIRNNPDGPGIQRTGGTIIAYANNITGNNTSGSGEQATSDSGSGEMRWNYWGCVTNCIPDSDADEWKYRLGAPVQSWAEGDGGTTLASTDGNTIALSGGTGTAVLVNHGVGTDQNNVPFAKFLAPYGSNRCADYIDAFVLDGASDCIVAV